MERTAPTAPAAGATIADLRAALTTALLAGANTSTIRRQIAEAEAAVTRQEAAATAAQDEDRQRLARLTAETSAAMAEVHRRILAGTLRGLQPAPLKNSNA